MDKKYYEKKLYTEYVRSFPNAEGKWKIVSTDEIVTAVEQEDIQGDPIIALEIEGERCFFYEIDFDNEIFVKLDEEGEPLA